MPVGFSKKCIFEESNTIVASVLESPSNIGINIENFRLENLNYCILVWDESKWSYIDSS